MFERVTYRTFSSPAARRIVSAAQAKAAAPVNTPPAAEPAAIPTTPPTARIAEIAAAIPARPSLRRILSATCKHFKLSRDELLSPQRFKRVVRPRWVAMYLMREMTGASLPQIAKWTGRADHTTVHHGIQALSALLGSGDPVASDLAAVRARLEGQQ